MPEADIASLLPILEDHCYHCLMPNVLKRGILWFCLVFTCFRWEVNLVPVTPSLLEADVKNIQFYNMDIRLL